MGLMFDDNNEVVCNKCGCHYVYEREEYIIDKKDYGYDIVYHETERRYAIRCSECNNLIAVNATSKLKELR